MIFHVKSRRSRLGEFPAQVVRTLQTSDFTLVFLTRLLVTMGIFTVQEFIQYYLGMSSALRMFLAGFGKVADTAEICCFLLSTGASFGSNYHYFGSRCSIGQIWPEDDGLHFRGAHGSGLPGICFVPFLHISSLNGHCLWPGLWSIRKFGLGNWHRMYSIHG